MVRSRMFLRVAFAACTLFLAASTPIAAHAQAPDNSAHNQSQKATADQSSNSSSDLEITQKIRKAVIADKSLSTYGHNCKIIALNGAVTLRGPVHSDDEKQAIAAHAAEVVGQDRVTNELTVKQ